MTEHNMGALVYSKCAWCKEVLDKTYDKKVLCKGCYRHAAPSVQAVYAVASTKEDADWLKVITGEDK